MSFKKCLAVIAIALGAFSVRADDQAMEAAGRKSFDAYRNAVITVNAIVKVTIFSDAQAKVGEQDKKNEVMATLIDPSGLAICSLAAIDPTTAVSTIRATVGGEEKKLTVKGELSEIKYRLGTGDEIDARLILKDEDQDLAFLFPVKPLEANAAKIAAVSLESSEKNIQLLDPMIFITRLGKTFSYESALITGRVTAKISKPRVEYLAGGQAGTPAFNRDGKLVGIILTHRRPETESSSDNVQPAVLVPGGDLVEPAKQALEISKKKNGDK